MKTLSLDGSREAVPDLSLKQSSKLGTLMKKMKPSTGDKSLKVDG